jgi:hypothetical protein
LVHRTCLRLLANPQDAEDASQAVFLILVHRPSMVAHNLAGWLHKVRVTPRLTCSRRGCAALAGSKPWLGRKRSRVPPNRSRCATRSKPPWSACRRR